MMILMPGLRLSSALLIAIFAITPFDGVASAAEPLVMPQELTDFARSHGRAPIDNFYERPGMLNPPYVYRFAAGDSEDSAALWCRRLQASDRPYLLLLKVADDRLLNGCPTQIGYWNYPKGLSVQTLTSLDLSEFVVATDPRHAGPKVIMPRAKVIVSEYDGVEDVFLCYQRAWLIRMRD